MVASFLFLPSLLKLIQVVALVEIIEQTTPLSELFVNASIYWHILTYWWHLITYCVCVRIRLCLLCACVCGSRCSRVSQWLDTVLHPIISPSYPHHETVIIINQPSNFSIIPMIFPSIVSWLNGHNHQSAVYTPKKIEHLISQKSCFL